jgi:hypothetical protein
VRTTPAPTIEFGGAQGANGWWKLERLPAVARAGQLVVIPLIENDGGRGYPNLRIEVRDRSDRAVQTIPVLSADEWEKLQKPDGSAGPDLLARIADANRELDKLHGLHDLVGMHALDVQVDPAAGKHAAHLAIGDGFDVDFNTDHLHVFRHNATRSFITLDSRGWLAKPRPLAGGEMCQNDAFLANTFHANGINVLLVQIGFTGTDTCWEPPDQLHVVAW